MIALSLRYRDKKKAPGGAFERLLELGVGQGKWYSRPLGGLWRLVAWRAWGAGPD